MTDRGDLGSAANGDSAVSPADGLVPAPQAVRAVGREAILAEYRDTATVLAATAAVRALAPRHLIELVPAERTLLLAGSTPRDAAELRALLEQLPAAPADQEATPAQTISVVYDGEDLDEVATALGMSTQALITAHTSTTWTAAFGGFAPGFAYLLPADDPSLRGPDAADGAPAPGADAPVGPPWDVPRRDEPRATVPAGAVALASRYSAVYPRSSPGGWQLIGSTTARLFDPSRTPPTLLVPGTPVRFEAQRPTARLAGATSTLARAGRQVTAVQAQLSRRRATASPRADEGAPALEVLLPGPLTVIEDTGRAGRGHIGVSTSGVFDRGALVRANLAVGNPAPTAGLETLIGPLHLRALASTMVAVDGAPAALSVRRRDADSADVDLGAEHSAGVAIPLDRGDLLELGPVAAGLRMVVAVRGGIASVHPAGGSGAFATGGAELGSLSSDTLSGLGPGPLGRGDVVHVGPDHGLDAVPSPADLGAATGDAEDTEDARRGETALEVELVLGPRDELLGPAAISALLKVSWTIRSDSDRVGVRLDGPALPVPAGAASLPSEAMVPGAVQVPPSGLPVIFGPDHPTTGGYPVIAVVSRAGLDLLAQAAPGTTVRLVARR